MNLDNLNKWLTLSANLGVLIGIIFVAIELSQNSEVLKAQIQAERFNRTVGFPEEILGNSELALAISKMENGEPLSPTENVLVRAMALREFRQIEWTFREVQAGRLSSSMMSFEVLRPGFQGKGIFRWPIGEYWLEMKKFMAPDFVSYIDENIVLYK